MAGLLRKPGSLLRPDRSSAPEPGLRSCSRTGRSGSCCFRSKTDLVQQFADRLSNVDSLSDAQALIAEFRALTGEVELPQELVAAIPFDLSKLQGLI